MNLELFPGLVINAQLGDQVMIILKLFIIFTQLIYIIFAAIVIRQVELVSRSLKGLVVFSIRWTAWLHLAASLMVLALSLLIL